MDDVCITENPCFSILLKSFKHLCNIFEIFLKSETFQGKLIHSSRELTQLFWNNHIQDERLILVEYL